jgi:phosphatidylglycerophosphate synthase
MRSSDIATISRVVLAVVIVYMIFLKVNPWATIALISVAFLSDAVDGYLAVREESKGSISFGYYLSAALGDKVAKAKLKPIKERIAKHVPYGPRMDVAGDRVMEFSFWITFTYLDIIPVIVFLLVVIRHAFADALMAGRGTSSKMKSKLAAAIYSSNLGRGGINIIKFLAYAYLVLVYVSGYPVDIGYALVAILFTYIMVRGAAEIYESLNNR